MALATRPKPKVQHRKRAAKHHKHTSHYLKTYWPYLPVLAIFGIGAAINRSLNDWGFFYAGANLNGLGEPTRIEAIAGSKANLALAVVIVVTGLAMAVFLATNWFRVQRTINRGEAFIAKHIWLDLLLAVIITIGVILTRQMA